MALEHFVVRRDSFCHGRSSKESKLLHMGSARPYVMHERFLQLDSITVWCRFTDEFILRPFFFEQNTSQGPPKGVPSRVFFITISFNSTSFPLYINDSA